MLYEVKEIIFIFFVLFIAQFIFLVVFNHFFKRPLLRNVRWISVSSCVAVIISLTLVPWVGSNAPLRWSEVPYNLIPFESIIGFLNHFYDVVPLRNLVGNIILLMPLGFFLKIRGAAKVILVGLLISLTIETLQLILTKNGVILPRAFDVDDIILNTAGFYIGYVCRIVIQSLSEKLKVKIKKGAEFNQEHG